MKKLMIMAVIAVSASVSFGAQSSWSTGYTYYNGVGSQLSDDTGADDFDGNAYLFAGLTEAQYDALTTEAIIWNAFHANGADSTLQIGSDSVKVTAYGALDYGAYDFEGTDAINYPVGSVYAAVIVTHEGDEGVDAYSANTMFGTATASNLGGVSEVALLWGDGVEGTGKATTWQEVESVPEPFSGTLALLGMGAIALRRKMKKAKKA